VDEPPFDPDYDRVPTVAYEGFDPGDEPLDDASTTRETSEEQAIRVLTETFGAEKIGEAKPHG
jgi:DNA polymerase-3 subunit gamma/tau